MINEKRINDFGWKISTGRVRVNRRIILKWCILCEKVDWI